MIGSLLVTYNETPDSRGGASFDVNINSVLRDFHFTDINNYYSTRLSVNDVIRFDSNLTAGLYTDISVIRRDFTTDDENGDRGIKETNVPYDIVSNTSSLYSIQFTATTIPSAYDFYYIISATTIAPTCFFIGSGFNSKTFQSKIQNDGKIVVGGNFTDYNGTIRNRIIRLNSNGVLDTTFLATTGTNARVRVVSLQSDQKILIGGDFTTYAGISRPSIARINTDGSLDTSFVIGAGFNNVLYEITVQSDGKIVCGGEFTTYSGASYNRIIRLNTDGSIDTGFTVGTGANLEVNNIKQQSDGKLLVGGSVTTYNGTSVGRFFRLNTNGTLDTSFSGITTGFNNSIYNITVLSDGKILVSGAFTTYNSITRRHIVRLNSDGSFDSSFSPLSSLTSTGIGRILGQAIQSDGKIIIVGNFDTINGQSSVGIARLNSDGTLDTSYNVGTGFNMGGDFTEDVQLTSDGKAIITGEFTSYNNTPANRIIRLNTDGSEDTCNVPVTPTPTPTVTVTPSITPTNTVTPSITPTNTVTPSITPTIDLSPTPTPSITPTNTVTPTQTQTQSATPTLTPTQSVTPSFTPTLTPTPTVSPVGQHNLVLWWSIENVNTNGGLFQNTIFDYYVSWDYSGTTGQTSTFTSSITPSSTPSIVYINTVTLPTYLNNVTGVTFTVHRKLCGARATGQKLNSNRDYNVLSNSSSYPASWGTYISPVTSGCVKTCFTTFNNMSGTFASRNMTLPYLHILVQDKVANSSC